MADRLTDFVHKCMKHGGVEGSVSFAGIGTKNEDQD